MPGFSADVPIHADIATRAWAAMTECAGYEAPAHATVEIHQGWVQDGLTGHAAVDSAGLWRIDVGYANSERALVHEIAHAWARSGPPTLVEGRADLLADCAVSLDAGLAPFDPDPGTDLPYMVQVRRWSPGAGEDAERHDGYLAAARLLRSLAVVLSPSELWPPSGTLRWRDLERVLADKGAPGATIQGVIDADLRAQRAALSDEDRDGMPWLAELLSGTDPGRWDSDGDGWWDGAPGSPAITAVPLPPDGTVVCTGLRGGSGGGVVQVMLAGPLRSEVTAAIVAGGAPITGDPSRGVRVPADMPVLLALSGPSTGGAWATVSGRDLVDDDGCHSSPSATVWVADPIIRPALDPFVDALAVELARAAELLGPPDHRLVVVLGTGDAGISSHGVHLSTGQVRWALEHQRMDVLAGLAIAVHRVWTSPGPSRSWDAAEALARTLIDEPPDLVLVASDLSDALTWQNRADRCPDGWSGLLADGCPKR